MVILLITVRQLLVSKLHPDLKLSEICRTCVLGVELDVACNEGSCNGDRFSRNGILEDL